MALESLLLVPELDADLADRNRWVIELGYWLRRPQKDEQIVDVHPEHTKLKALLKLLDQKPDIKLKVARVLRSVIRDNDALSLLCDTGVATKNSFWSEVFERIRNRFIAPPPNRPELSVLFSLGFVGQHDAKWVYDLDRDLLNQLSELLAHGQEKGEENHLFDDLAESIRILISYITAAGLSYSVRSRLRDVIGQHSPFYELGRTAEQILATQTQQQDLVHQGLVAQFKKNIDDCYIACDDVYTHLDENGVSIETVFLVETMRLRLSRIEVLLRTWLDRANPENYSELVAELILTVQGHQSISRLFEQSFALLSRKVVERSAEKGEHYIASSRQDYFKMLKSALGGGGVVAGTVYLKFLISSIGLPRFFENIFQAVNYVSSFLLIQFANFTLATKQPAMTAPALAQLLDDAKSEEGIDRFVDRAVALIRSQSAAVFGNVVMVTPIAAIIQLLIYYGFGKNSMSDVQAMAIIQSVSPFSAALLFAAFTGVLLWLSSLMAGLVDNWFVLHHMQDVIRYNRRLNILVGSRRAAGWATWWRENISVVVANLSLGLLLVYGPAFIGFIGIHMDVRHVTLATGSFVAAAVTLGWKVLLTFGFWFGMIGIFLIGILNVLVSFALAFNMALRSRDLPEVDRSVLYKALRNKIRSDVKGVIFPPK